jgi:hypothetical protein
MKFKEYVEGVKKMLEEHPDWGELEMTQVERWEGEDVCLPWHEEPFMSFEDGRIYL